jgi:hypothetical protein
MADDAAATEKSAKEFDDLEKAQRALADVYTFVRSQELTRTIGSYTFDHYIDEAKRAIKGTGRQIVDAAGQPIDEDPKLSTRPSQLQYIDNIEKDFTDLYATMEDLANKSDQGTPV